MRCAGHPSGIFLDEPTTGLDPRSRLALWELIAGLAGSGVTVFLTTQHLEEVDRLADRVALIDGGRIVAEGTPAELKHRVGGSRLDLATVNDRAFVPIATMPSWLQGFARHQPVTPVTETIRAALLGAPAGNDAWLAVAWCAVIIVGSIALSAALFRRRTA